MSGRLLVVVFWVVAMAVVATGCSEAPSRAPVASGPLLTVTTRGGECVDGPCGTTVVIERDGRVHAAAKPPNDLGRVPPTVLQTLGALIATTDFSIVRARPFRGDCPTAYDGQEHVFEFGTPGGIERIATCEVVVDYRHPLFVAVATALGPYLRLPTT